MRRFIWIALVCLLTAACGQGAEVVSTGAPTTAPSEPSAPPSSEAPTAPSAPATPETATTAVTSPAVATTTSTTIPPGPPMLEVMSPAANEHVDVRHLRFVGVTDPGCEVEAAGRYSVPVADDGSFEAVLILNPGGNVATFTATDPWGGSSELRVPVYYDPPLELRVDGLGEVDFQTSMDDAMAAFEAVLGPPDVDDIVDRASLPPETRDDEWGIFSATAYPGHDYARFVTWEGAGLMAMFSDSVPASDERLVNFNGWAAHDPGEYGTRLVTDVGVGVGSTLADLEAAYGDALTWYAEPDEFAGGYHFSIATDIPSWYEDEVRSYHGMFSGDPGRPGTTVAELQAGFGFDTC